MTIHKRGMHAILVGALALAPVALAQAPAPAAAPVPPPAAVPPPPQSGPALEVRARHEAVDDDAFDNRAEADTLRVRLGYRWIFAPGWTVFASAEGIGNLGSGGYNTTANGNTTYPVIADPPGTEWDEAWLGWNGNPKFEARLGRQKLILDNARFFGNVGWRQNQQTFDAAMLAWKPAAPWALRYLYLDQANRVFGNYNPNPLLAAYDLDANLLNASWTQPWGQVVGYGYFVDNQDVPLSSTRTLGLRLTAKHAVSPAWTVGVAAEFADQSPYADGADINDASYLLVEPWAAWRGHTFKAGYEVLGGDGRYGFATPFATLHVFNGWADKFLATPRDGLRDAYAGASGPIAAGWNYGLWWHDFEADDGGASYGQELDASLGRGFAKHWSVLFKYADYQADEFARDTRKVWIQVEYIL